jgi:hypothetical protein
MSTCSPGAKAQLEGFATATLRRALRGWPWPQLQLWPQDLLAEQLSPMRTKTTVCLVSITVALLVINVPTAGQGVELFINILC